MKAPQSIVGRAAGKALVKFMDLGEKQELAGERMLRTLA